MIVGLGNPGAKYELTRHNVGFLVVDEIARQHRIDLGQHKFDGFWGRGQVLGESCLLVKPQTYMNLSGRCVTAFMRYFKVDSEDLLVIHDDIDMDPTKVKAKVGGGHGGNNGVRSIISELGNPDFHRIKVGVGRPKELKDGDVSNWVLKPLSDVELTAIQKDVYEHVLTRIRGVFLNP